MVIPAGKGSLIMGPRIVRVLILVALLGAFGGVSYYYALPTIQRHIAANNPQTPPPGSKKGPKKGRRPKSGNRMTTGTMARNGATTGTQALSRATTGTLSRVALGTTATLALENAVTTAPAKAARKK